MYFVIQNLAKYFSMLVYVIFNSVTVQIRPIFVYSPLFVGYNAVGYIWKCVQKTWLKWPSTTVCDIRIINKIVKISYLWCLFLNSWSEQTLIGLNELSTVMLLLHNRNAIFKKNDIDDKWDDIFHAEKT